MSLISDKQRLVGAKTRFGNTIRVYDDGFGDLYIMRDSMSIMGIVRARSWEDAWGICEDEFFPEATETMDDIRAEYGPEWSENPLFQEAFGFRNNQNEKDVLKHGIYAKDLNGESLNELNQMLLESLEITLQFGNHDCTISEDGVFIE